MRFWAGTLLALLCPASVFAQDAEIAEVRAHLFYEYTGVLSDNILDSDREREFAGWNVIIGEGDARQPADNLLVNVVVRTEGHQYLDEPLEIWVSDSEGNVLASRTKHGLLSSYEGYVHTPLWVNGVGCIGTFSINARFRGESVAEDLSFFCGE